MKGGAGRTKQVLTERAFIWRGGLSIATLEILEAGIQCCQITPGFDRGTEVKHLYLKKKINRAIVEDA